MRVFLQRQWLYKGERYGPGQAEVPDAMLPKLRACGVIADDSKGKKSAAKASKPADGDSPPTEGASDAT